MLHTIHPLLFKNSVIRKVCYFVIVAATTDDLPQEMIFNASVRTTDTHTRTHKHHLACILRSGQRPFYVSQPGKRGKHFG